MKFNQNWSAISLALLTLSACEVETALEKDLRLVGERVFLGTSQNKVRAQMGTPLYQQQQGARACDLFDGGESHDGQKLLHEVRYFQNVVVASIGQIDGGLLICDPNGESSF